MLERILDRARGEVDLVLREMHERESRLCVPAAVMRLEKRGLRTGDIATLQANPTELAERPTELPAQVGP